MSLRDEILMDIALSVDNEGNILEYETLQYEDEFTAFGLKAKIPYKYGDQIDKFYVVMEGFTPVLKLKDGEKIDENRLLTDAQAKTYQDIRVERVKAMNKLAVQNGANIKPERTGVINENLAEGDVTNVPEFNTDENEENEPVTDQYSDNSEF